MDLLTPFRIYRKKMAPASRGQSMAEYALILGVVALATVLALQTFRTDIAAIFQSFAAAANGG